MNERSKWLRNEWKYNKNGEISGPDPFCFPFPGGWLDGRNLKKIKDKIIITKRLKRSKNPKSLFSVTVDEDVDFCKQLLKRGGDWIPALPLSSLLLHLSARP